ncbi:MAG TPA: PilZ domain-containing protein, partial [Myxococcota bacterium]|nr:PilZ domain-containing protein [Myxococcota bacterium]
STPAETRGMRQTRIRTAIPVEICTGGRVVEGTVRNASHGGMFVETRAVPAQGEPVSLRFSTRDEIPIELTGLVWWTTEDSPYRHARRGFGLRLLEDDVRYSAMLSRMAS